MQPTGEEELLHVDYPRVRVPVWQAAIVVVVLLAAAVAFRGARTQQPVAPQPLIVAVVGEVEQPGLVTLTPGARAAEALDAARPLPGANLTAINLAQRLEDGQQIVVAPTPEAPIPGAAPGAEPGKLSLNQATAAELEELQGIGEVTAAAIIDYRESIGGFTSVEQLQEVTGIGPAKFAQISGQVQL